MSSATTKLGLPYIASGQAQKYITHNEALTRLDRLLFISCRSATQTSPPPSSGLEDLYLVPHEAAEGVWQNHSNSIASWNGEDWQYQAPFKGWLIFVEDVSSILVYDGNQWVKSQQGYNDLEYIAINTEVDSYNRISVAADATLFSHEGRGHQLKINKNDIQDTASIVFQSDYKGHAELGLVGTNHMTLKVSENGRDWSEAWQISNINGDSRFSGKVTIDNNMHCHRFVASSAKTKYFVNNIDNKHSEAVSSQIEFAFQSSRRFAIGVNDQKKSFQITAYDSLGTWKGNPITIEYADSNPLTNAVYIDKNGRVGIGGIPTTHLTINGIAKLERQSTEDLSPAAEVGSGAIAMWMSTTGIKPIYSDGKDWLSLVNGNVVQDV